MKKTDQSQLASASKNTIKTLLLGKRDALDRELVQAYANSRVHILTISGLHIGIIMLSLGFVLQPIQSIPGGGFKLSASFYCCGLLLSLQEAVPL